MNHDTYWKEKKTRRKDLRHCKEQTSLKKTKLCPRSRLAQNKALPRRRLAQNKALSKEEPGALRPLERAVETAEAATPGMSFLVTPMNRNLSSCL